MTENYNPEDHMVGFASFVTGIGIFLVVLSFMIALLPL
jgi:hypothetical protein